MSSFKHEVQAAQRRLWLDRWLRLWGWALVGCAATWLLVVVADRLFALRLPLGWMAAGAMGASVVLAAVWCWLTREPMLAAARALDHAAGLRERVSTSLMLFGSAAAPGSGGEPGGGDAPVGGVAPGGSSVDDAFARAVLADAERRLSGVKAGRLIRVGWSRSMSWGLAMALAAALSLLLPEFDILKKNESRAQAAARQAALNRVRSVVARPVTAMQQIADKQGDAALKSQLAQLEQSLERDPNADAEVVRREAAKQLDRLQDALKKKTEDDRFRALEDTKKRLSQIGSPNDPKGEAAKLMESMAAGDFAAARDEAKRLQESLAKRAAEGKVDPKQAAEMRKQLSELAEKLNKAAEDKQSERELKNAGMNQEQAERVLDALSRKDKKQLEKLAQELAESLKDKGLTEEQIKQMAEKIQQRQQAAQQCKQMSRSMDAAGAKLDSGDMQGAASEMGEAAEMLDEMEQMEQALNEIDAQMSQLADAREDLSQDGQGEGQGEGEGEGEGEGDKCGGCKGSGFRTDGSPCPGCNGTGEGQGGRGRGSGTRERGEAGDVDFVNRKEKTKQARTGKIIGQQFVKGEQLKGKSEVEMMDVSRAAEIDAADAINKDRIPRVYRKGVKNYFDRLGDGMSKGAGKGEGAGQSDAGGSADGGKSGETGGGSGKSGDVGSSGGSGSGGKSGGDRP